MSQVKSNLFVIDGELISASHDNKNLIFQSLIFRSQLCENASVSVSAGQRHRPDAWADRNRFWWVGRAPAGSMLLWSMTLSDSRGVRGARAKRGPFGKSTLYLLELES